LHRLLYRDEKLLAQGLDPRQFKDPEDGKQQEIKLVFPPLPEFSGGTASPSEQTPEPAVPGARPTRWEPSQHWEES